MNFDFFLMITQKQFQKSLLEQKNIGKKDIKQILLEAKQKKKSIEEVLVEKGIMTKEELIEFRVKLLKIPEADLTIVLSDVFNLLPTSLIKELNILPVSFDKNKKEITIATCEPENLELLDFIQKKTGLRVVFQYAKRKLITQIMQQNIDFLEKDKSEKIQEEKKGAEKKERPEESENEEGILIEKEGELELGTDNILAKVEEKSIIKLVESIVKDAISFAASDIHIEPQENNLVIRYRVDGILRDALSLPKNLTAGVIARIKVLSNLKLDEHRLPQDGRFKIKASGRNFSFRVSILPVYDGEKAAIRILEEVATVYTLEELGFLPAQADLIRKKLKEPWGMILATGPTGSGKTTTLYTAVSILNSRERNISTIEDPVEYRITGINQSQVRPEIGFSFASGLRSLLRQDPDILMVGEIRDNETAALAINAALTGHLVFSTLHTNNAAGALPRLLDMKIEGFLIASTVNLIIAQRLVRKLEPSLKIPYKLDKDQISELSKIVKMDNIRAVFEKEGIIEPQSPLENLTWYKPGSSRECPSGYKGRLAIAEVLDVDLEIQKLIFRNATADKIEEYSKSIGTLAMMETGFLSAARGITSIEEILRVSKE